MNENVRWLAGNLSYCIASRFDSTHNLVASVTWWRDENALTVHDWLKADPKNKVIIISLFDPPWEVQELELLQGDRVKSIYPEDLCFWVIACGFYFQKYEIEELYPIEFLNKFLCYQRKPHQHRTILHNHLHDLEGIITLGDRRFEFNDVIPFDNKNADEQVDNLMVANDIWTLGNREIWNRSFLNIISETPQRSYHPPFLSEKSFKPIIGMRPFLSYGHREIDTRLKSLGFATFEEDFGYVPTDSHHDNAVQIRDIIKRLGDVDKLYRDLMPKILHNKNQFRTAYRNELAVIDGLVDQYRVW